MEDRSSWLDDVASRLRMRPEATDEIIEELETHIESARAEFEGAGIAPDEAERRAVRLMGRAEEVARGLRRAHQSRRRLLAAVGGSVFRNLLPAFLTYLVAVMGSTLAVYGVGAFLSVVALALGRDFPLQLVDASAVIMIVTVLFTVWRLGENLPLEIAVRANRRAADLRWSVGIAGAVLVAVPAWFLAWEHTWITAAGCTILPFVFLHGARRSARTLYDRLDRAAIAARRYASWRGLALMAAGSCLLAVPLVFVIAAVRPPVQPDGGGAPRDEELLVGHPEIAVRVVASSAFDLVGPHRSPLIVVSFADDEIDWDDWRDLRLELWPALADQRGDAVAIAPGARPLARIPVDPWVGRLTIDRSRHRDGGPWVAVLTGTDPGTGERVALGDPVTGDAQFRGSLLDWLVAEP